MRPNHLRRREFITLLGGTMAWPVAAGAEQADRKRRIGVLMGFDENDPKAKGWLSDFTQGLAELGWTDGRARGWTSVGPPAVLTGCGPSRKSWSNCGPT
jgi:hypothetical protein